MATAHSCSRLWQAAAPCRQIAMVDGAFPLEGSSGLAGGFISKPPLCRSACVMLIGMDVDELQHALGGVVLESAYMERVLRAAFSALVGSKYAAVVDARLIAAALIEDCERITRHHTGMFEQAKDALPIALIAPKGTICTSF
jgi:hypothetical protein